MQDKKMRRFFLMARPREAVQNGQRPFEMAPKVDKSGLCYKMADVYLFSQPLTSNGRDLARKRKEQVKYLLSMRWAKFGRTNPFAGFYSDIEFTGKLSMMPRRPILF